MLYKSPQYINDMIMSDVRYQNGPAVIDRSAIAAAHNADQAKRQAYIENTGQGLALNKMMHDRQMGLAKRKAKFAETQGNISNAIAALGLGVSAYGSSQARDQAAERNAAMDKLIADMNATGDQSAANYARLLSILRQR